MEVKVLRALRLVENRTIRCSPSPLTFTFSSYEGKTQKATKTQTIEVKVDERLAGEIAGKAVHGWHATAYSDGKKRVYVTFEEVKTVGN